MKAIVKNIRKIRSVKKISQQAFADMFGITRASIGSYEEGRAEPKLQLASDIAKKFSIPVDVLLNQELTVDDITGFGRRDAVATARTKSLAKGYKFMKKCLLVDENNMWHYHQNLQNPSFLAELPQMEIPFFGKHPELRAFSVPDHLLLARAGGLQKGDIVVAMKVPVDAPQLWQHDHLYVLVLTDKLMIRWLQFDAKGIFASTASGYESALLNLDELQEMWHVEKVLQAAPLRPNAEQHSSV